MDYTEKIMAAYAARRTIADCRASETTKRGYRDVGGKILDAALECTEEQCMPDLIGESIRLFCEATSVNTYRGRLRSVTFVVVEVFDGKFDRLRKKYIRTDKQHVDELDLMEILGLLYTAEFLLRLRSTRRCSFNMHR